ncbi:class I SAM-dependent methyltransferase [Thiobaca trueperi]|uniref:Phosphatidylethanolamine N-methyltransferase /phosphatidyl-N-methylethanolamine N-methyltransferase n=1 Tax=Thiobaca trueperi TaxID=127458 RepID=A0A4R3N436_9GAMM|nr:class I SAM-dependent methyltransferase [Thiobaca trueperi]TCT21469.1 phosphatidylethanolamine N-methyltransferase /phosphatidyl-N-methylethanolamine N-methyltransferase [Thiobaca trueperi]
MDIALLQKTYRRYANHYDYLFGPILHPGRRLTVSLANTKPHQQILEVGVGTGLSLPFYRPDSRVTGIDISPEMLDKARQRVAGCNLLHVEALHEMDAEHMDFPDATFDTVVAMYVASVVPNPHRLIDEMQRVCKPGGDIILVNHFASRQPVLRKIEAMLRPLSVTLGFRPDMALESLFDAADLQRIQVINTNFLGYWKLIHYRNEASLAFAGSESQAI